MVLEKQAHTKQWSSIIVFGISVMLLAQLKVGLLANDFKISVGIILLPVLLCLLDDFPLIPVTIVSAVFVFLSRILFGLFFLEGTTVSFHAHVPEVLFYLVYGGLLYGYYHWRGRELPMPSAILPLACMDYLANTCELLMRVGIGTFGAKTQISLVMIACTRTALIWFILVALRRYGLLLMSREDSIRYKKLLILISKLKSEMVWMEKNATLIENTMSTSYQLYHQLKDIPQEEQFAKSALSIAKDVHEVKKEYYLIMRGIREALNADTVQEGMYVTEMLAILTETLKQSAKETGMELSIEVQCDPKIYTNRQYLLMSVFQNLFTNALEAAKENKISIVITQKEDETYYHFAVADNGTGIDQEAFQQIFTPGFSTKINFDTGEINRGLGLCLMKDIVESEFQGDISAQSDGLGTTFYFSLLKTELEEPIYETISR